MSLSGDVEIPRSFDAAQGMLQAKRSFVMRVLRRTQDKLRSASRSVSVKLKELVWISAFAGMTEREKSRFRAEGGLIFV
jgi:hypothetical protein